MGLCLWCQTWLRSSAYLLLFFVSNNTEMSWGLWKRLSLWWRISLTFRLNVNVPNNQIPDHLRYLLKFSQLKACGNIDLTEPTTLLHNMEKESSPWTFSGSSKIIPVQIIVLLYRACISTSHLHDIGVLVCIKPAGCLMEVVSILSPRQGHYAAMMNMMSLFSILTESLSLRDAFPSARAWALNWEILSDESRERGQRDCAVGSVSSASSLSGWQGTVRLFIITGSTSHRQRGEEDGIKKKKRAKQSNEHRTLIKM